MTANWTYRTVDAKKTYVPLKVLFAQFGRCQPKGGGSGGGPKQRRRYKPKPTAKPRYRRRPRASRPKR